MQKLSYTINDRPEFTYCEHVMATPWSRWHLRRFGKDGEWKLGGGCPPPLCWPADRDWTGWDLEVCVCVEHDDHTCPECLAIYKKLKENNDGTHSKR